MAWIVHSREAAEASAVMFAITPGYIADVYNRYRNEVGEDHEDYRDLWGELTEETRHHQIRTVDLYIDKHMANIDEDIEDCITWVEKNPEEAAGRPPLCADGRPS